MLTEKDILNKKFAKDCKGYDAAEVDLFLDEVIRDYGSFRQTIAARDAEIGEWKNALAALRQQAASDEVSALKSRIRSLEIENASFRNKLQGIKPSDEITAESMDHLKRIRALEGFVWQLGFDPLTFKRRNS